MRWLVVLILSGAALGASGDVLHVASHADRFAAISREIWESPELGFHENKSSAILQQELRANGFAIQPGVAGMRPPSRLPGAAAGP